MVVPKEAVGLSPSPNHLCGLVFVDMVYVVCAYIHNLQSGYAEFCCLSRCILYAASFKYSSLHIRCLANCFISKASFWLLLHLHSNSFRISDPGEM